MNLPMIIQGGMGVSISDWNLANTVSSHGHLGVVSGTGIGLVMLARLMDGDAGGHIRWALNQFPFQKPVQKILKDYYVPRSGSRYQPYKRPSMWTLNPPPFLNELTVIANFVEVLLAKKGHVNPVGLNLLEKVQLPIMASIYGAMLADVDFIFMGAGIPGQVPGILDQLIEHKAVSYRVDVQGATQADDFRIHFNPQTIFPGAAEKMGELRRPQFIPIISSVVLAKALIKRASGTIDGFVIEGPAAGGHNAPPRGRIRLNERGEPIYGPKDVVVLDEIKALGLPFWLAGGFGSPEKLQEAIALGATGIQVGTAFAYCSDSGMDKSIRTRIVQRGLENKINVRTDPVVSGTGFPFKVVELEGTLSEPQVYERRIRICDLGMLRQLYKQEDGKVGFRCPAEPEELYVATGGNLEDTIGKSCLCNNLCATAGYPQYRQGGYVEPALVTAGDGLNSVSKFVKPGSNSYSAKDVLDCLTGRICQT